MVMMTNQGEWSPYEPIADKNPVTVMMKMDPPYAVCETPKEASNNYAAM
jgi:hypothetical protein